MSIEIFQPKTLDEALGLRKSNTKATLLAGGTDLIVRMNKGSDIDGDIIDLSKLKELQGIVVHGDEVKVGSMVTFTQIEDSEILKEHVSILTQAASAVGSPQIRNKGTIGGNLCNANPAADLIPPLVCPEAKVELQSLDEKGKIKKRHVALEDFIVGRGWVSLKKNELLTWIIFSIPSKDASMNFKKIGRRNALAIARINGACIVRISDNKITDIKLSSGAMASAPGRLTIVEEYLKGKELNSKNLKKAGELASEHALKYVSGRPSKAYKLPVLSKFVGALITEACN